MRIALLSYRSKTHCGGQGVYVRHLSRGLVELGHDVEVFSGQPYPDGLDPRVRLTKVPSLDLYREPDPFRVPWPSEINDRIDLLELLTTWTAGVPRAAHVQPPGRTGARRPAGRLRRRPRQPVPRHRAAEDRRSSVCRWSRRCTIRSPATASLDVAAAQWWRKPLVRRWYGFAEMQKQVARQIPELLTVSSTSAADIAEDFGVDRRASCMSCRWASTPSCSSPPTEPGAQPHHRDRQRRRSAQGRQPSAARDRPAARRARPRTAARRQARAQRPHREADRRAGHLRHRAQLQRGVRRRSWPSCWRRPKSPASRRCTKASRCPPSRRWPAGHRSSRAGRERCPRWSAPTASAHGW